MAVILWFLYEGEVEEEQGENAAATVGLVPIGHIGKWGRGLTVAWRSACGLKRANHHHHHKIIIQQHSATRAKIY